MDKTQIINVDAPRTTSKQAIELMVHHLQLAAMYFEATPLDVEKLITECLELIGDDGGSCAKASIAFLRAIDKYFNDLDTIDRNEYKYDE